MTTGDKITPGAVEYNYPLLFDDRSILLMAYPLETVLAEKLETVVSRGAGNTRPRDFYDIHVLWRLKSSDCGTADLKDALVATCEKRGSIETMHRWESVLSEVVGSEAMQGLWAKYTRQNTYAADLSLEEACGTAKEILGVIETHQTC